jgi:raffinose/stachyose/melibiose transport system permease protein
VVTSYNNFAQRFSRDWTMTSAAAIMMILPVIIIFLSLQRRFIEGLTQGGIKG